MADYLRYTKPKDLIRMTFNQLIAEDLENKRVFDMKFDGYCSKCGTDLPKWSKFTFYGRGKKICLNCHENIIEFTKLNMF
jgi:hypothetical protein